MLKIERPTIGVDAVTTFAKDAAFVTIGFAVLAFQSAQVRRREASKAVADQIGTGKVFLEDAVNAIRATISDGQSK